MEKLETVLESVEVPYLKSNGIESLMDCHHNLKPYDCFQCQNQFDEMNEPKEKHDFFPTNTGLSIKHNVPDVDMHDTYKYDRYDNLYGGHTSIHIGDKRKTLDFLDDI
jgi:hypothetical protein